MRLQVRYEPCGETRLRASRTMRQCRRGYRPRELRRRALRPLAQLTRRTRHAGMVPRVQARGGGCAQSGAAAQWCRKPPKKSRTRRTGTVCAGRKLFFGFGVRRATPPVLFHHGVVEADRGITWPVPDTSRGAPGRNPSARPEGAAKRITLHQVLAASAIDRGGR